MIKQKKISKVSDDPFGNYDPKSDTNLGVAGKRMRQMASKAWEDALQMVDSSDSPTIEGLKILLHDLIDHEIDRVRLLKKGVKCRDGGRKMCENYFINEMKIVMGQGHGCVKTHLSDVI